MRYLANSIGVMGCGWMGRWIGIVVMRYNDMLIYGDCDGMWDMLICGRWGDCIWEVVDDEIVYVGDEICGVWIRAIVVTLRIWGDFDDGVFVRCGCVR